MLPEDDEQTTEQQQADHVAEQQSGTDTDKADQSTAETKPEKKKRKEPVQHIPKSGAAFHG